MATPTLVLSRGSTLVGGRQISTGWFNLYYYTSIDSQPWTCPGKGKWGSEHRVSMSASWWANKTRFPPSQNHLLSLDTGSYPGLGTTNIRPTSTRRPRWYKGVPRSPTSGKSQLHRLFPRGRAWHEGGYPVAYPGHWCAKGTPYKRATLQVTPEQGNERGEVDGWCRALNASPSSPA